MWLNWYTAAIKLKFESLDFCHQSRVFKTRDANMQNLFHRMLTYHIFSLHYANLQNPSFLGIRRIMFMLPFDFGK